MTWSTGDGGVTTCDGPGISVRAGAVIVSTINLLLPHVHHLLLGQPSPDGNPNDGLQPYQSLSTGPCPGQLKAIPVEETCPRCLTTSSRSVRVEQVESIDAGRVPLR